MIMRDAVVEDSGNFDHVGLFNGPTTFPPPSEMQLPQPCFGNVELPGGIILSIGTEPDGAAARAHVRSRKTDPFSVDVLESGSIQSPRRTRTLLKGSRNRAYRRNRQAHICGKTYRLPRRHVPAKRKMPGATSVRPEEAGPRGPWRRCHVWRDAVTNELVQDEGGVAINDTPFPPDSPVTS
ncbi:hypothetical protein HPB51_001034 [Rhipicephalus microplus]|uniref:Uncharacterized protein n=1 Tax=Rhipicephalus microplus TaxID=6941 RepID=A0A9J6EEA4_RHIMP|nr:hypothetical protein HPB51_001034 [Rhipicephalus microplus]